MTTATARRDRGALANGVRYLVRERPGAEVTTVSVWILVGSRDEALPGAAHLLEHVAMQAVPAGRRRSEQSYHLGRSSRQSAVDRSRDRAVGSFSRLPQNMRDARGARAD